MTTDLLRHWPSNITYEKRQQAVLGAIKNPCPPNFKCVRVDSQLLALLGRPGKVKSRDEKLTDVTRNIGGINMPRKEVNSETAAKKKKTEKVKKKKKKKTKKKTTSAAAAPI